MILCRKATIVGILLLSEILGNSFIYNEILSIIRNVLFIQSFLNAYSFPMRNSDFGIIYLSNYINRQVLGLFVMFSIVVHWYLPHWYFSLI